LLGKLLGVSVGSSTGALPLQAARVVKEMMVKAVTTARFLTRNLLVLAVGVEHDFTRSP
jgi:hypothetical protein